MNRHSRQQHGAILIMVAIAAVVIIGIGALALDLGRLFVQKTELQNAADAAALAAAVELDGESDAQTRAKAAAWQLLNDRGIFVSVAGDFTAEEDITDFKFYSDIDPVKLPGVNGGAAAAESRFVSLTVDLTQEGEGLQLFFLPVLRLIPGVDAPTEEGTRASALAGVENVPCYQPAMFMCVDDKSNLPFEVGEMAWLRAQQGSDAAWTEGNFGFLLPSSSKTGAPALNEYLAAAGQEVCDQDAQYGAKTGTVAQQATRGVNTRFDIYKSNSPADYPPAPDIITYPLDAPFVGGVPPSDDAFRVGDGNWNRNGYWNKYHAHPSQGHTQPAGYANWTRWQTYQWELGLLNDNLTPAAAPGTNTRMPADRVAEPAPGPGPYADQEDTVIYPDIGQYTCDPGSTNPPYLPTMCHGEPDPTHFYCLQGDATCDNYQSIPNIYPTVAYSTPSFPSDLVTGNSIPLSTTAERRLMYVAALQCEDLSLNGSFDESNVDIMKESKILQFFLTQPATDPGGSLTKFEIFGEYIGPVQEGGGVTRRIIQLYE